MGGESAREGPHRLGFPILPLVCWWVLTYLVRSLLSCFPEVVLGAPEVPKLKAFVFPKPEQPCCLGLEIGDL